MKVGNVTYAVGSETREEGFVVIKLWVIKETLNELLRLKWMKQLDMLLRMYKKIINENK